MLICVAATENMWELMDAPYEGTGMNSRNHHMWSSVSTYLVQQVAGLNQQPSSAGYSDVLFNPGAMPGNVGRGGVSAASASLDLPRGQVAIDWAWSGGTHCATAADGSDMTLSCGTDGGTISEIVFASYGAPEGQCGSFIANSDCDHGSAPLALEKLCLGQQSCTFQVGAAIMGATEAASCAKDASHAQRLHAQVTCSAPASLHLQATVPLSSVGTVSLETTGTSKLMLDNVTIWDRKDRTAEAMAGLATGVRGAVTSQQQGRELVDVAVGSGSFSFTLV